MAYFRKRGSSWEYRIKYNDAGKQKTLSKSGFKTKAEARAAAILVEEKLFKGGIVSVKKGEKLFEDWVEVYKQMHNVHRRESSNIAAKNGQEKLLQRFSGMKLNAIKRSDYQIYINQLLFENDYSKNTVDRIHGEMMAIMNSAVEHDELEKNLLRGIHISKEEEEKVVFLTKAETQQLLTAIEKESIFKRIMVIILLRTGIRSGELLGLLWSDIDFENKTLTVERQRSRLGIGPPKSKSSVRTISIDDTLISELLLYKAWQEENERTNSNYQKSDYVMVDENGKPFYITKPQDMMKNLLRYAKLPPRKSAHLLRHTHAVLLLEAGVDIKTVSNRLGHKNIDITANTYLHVTQEHERNGLKKFDEYLKF